MLLREPRVHVLRLLCVYLDKIKLSLSCISNCLFYDINLLINV